MSSYSYFEPERSVLDDLGEEITGVAWPVSICMAVTVFLVRVLNPTGASSASTVFIASAAYNENANPEATSAEKLGGALMNAIIFICVIAAMTVVLFFLFKYGCYRVIFGYMGFAVMNILFLITGLLLIQLLQVGHVHVDSFSLCYMLWNFSIVGMLGILFMPMPLLMKQCYMVWVGIIVAYIFTWIPDWTSWVLLVFMALYDIAAVLIPGGPLKMLVELAVERQQALPALIYESRPAGGYRGANHWTDRRGGTVAGDNPEDGSAAGAAQGQPRQQQMTAEGGGGGGGGGQRPVAEALGPPPQSATAAGGVVARRPSLMELSSQSPRVSQQTVRQAAVMTGGDGGNGAVPPSGGRPLGEGREGSGGRGADTAGPYVPLTDAPAVNQEGPELQGATGGQPQRPHRGSGAVLVGSDGPLQPLIDDNDEEEGCGAGGGTSGGGGNEDTAAASVAAVSAAVVRAPPPEQQQQQQQRLGGSQVPVSPLRSGPNARTSPASSVSNVVMGLASTAVVPMPQQQPGQNTTPSAADATVDGRSPRPSGQAEAAAAVPGAADAPHPPRRDGDDDDDDMLEMPDGVKLGLGDFIFYSMLVGKAAETDMMTVFAAFIGIIAGLGITLLCLAVYKRALPALPFSIALGVMFYFTTLIVTEQYVTPLTTHYTFY